MGKTRSVSELLAEGKAALERLKAGADAAQAILVALQRALPPEIAAHVFGAVLDDDRVLTVLVDSGAFATRLRYLLAEHGDGLAGRLGVESVARIVVRVRPRAAARGAGDGRGRQ